MTEEKKKIGEETTFVFSNNFVMTDGPEETDTIRAVGFDGSAREIPTLPSDSGFWRPSPGPRYPLPPTRVPWGPTGETVYKRTYSRVKPDGGRETWPETVERVVDGNLALADDRHRAPVEREDLTRMIREFKIIPAGRHLWASGVRGRQYLFNCHVSHWQKDATPAEHFRFSFLRLMEGGGVGANYSNHYLDRYPVIRGTHRVHVVCDPEHPDYEKMRAAGVLSEEYNWDWPGAFDVEDSREGWAGALVDLLTTYYRDADNINRVFDVSRVRGEGARLKTFGGRASGPLPLARMLHVVADIMNDASGNRLDGIRAMGIDHAVAECVVSGGNRRSARMSIMHWNDPQIREFIYAKADGKSHWTTNISVEVDDTFFNPPASYREDADVVLSAIAHGMLKNGEPGFWNSSLSNVGEPNPVVCTNPCGEIALEPWENCNLGHVNLAAFIRPNGETDVDGLIYAHRLMTRFLIRATHGDVTDGKQAAILARNRRIGVGHLGVASYLALKGHRYEVAFGSEFGELLTELAHTVDDEAVDYSHALRIPVPVKTRTVAPTGTIAKMPGVSEGIHPIFAKYFIRRIRFSKVDPDQMATVEEYRDAGYTVEDDRQAEETVVVAMPTMDTLVEQVAARYGAESADRIVQSADDCSLEGMLTFQSQYQRLWADNAVSYTVNFDPGRYSAGHVANVIRTFGPKLKGATLFPEASYDQAPYERITKEGYVELSARTGGYDVADSVDEECVNGCPIK